MCAPRALFLRLAYLSFSLPSLERNQKLLIFFKLLDIQSDTNLLGVKIWAKFKMGN
jgi:hypothetical protein